MKRKQMLSNRTSIQPVHGLLIISGVCWYIANKIYLVTLVDFWKLFVIAGLTAATCIFIVYFKRMSVYIFKTKDNNKLSLIEKIILNAFLIVSIFIFVGIVPVSGALGINYLLKGVNYELIEGRVDRVTKGGLYRYGYYTSIQVDLKDFVKELHYSIDDLETLKKLEGRNVTFRSFNGYLGWKVVRPH